MPYYCMDIVLSIQKFENETFKCSEIRSPNIKIELSGNFLDIPLDSIRFDLQWKLGTGDGIGDFPQNLNHSLPSC